MLGEHTKTPEHQVWDPSLIYRTQDGNRTHDLRIMRAMLHQLSYRAKAQRRI
ncbi:MAG: hypothetical protein RIR69_1457 [Actinomycetota bacterium]